MNKKAGQKRSPVSWLMELAAPRRWEYLFSVLTALAGVACSLTPYLIMIELIHTLLNGTARFRIGWHHSGFIQQIKNTDCAIFQIFIS